MSPVFTVKAVPNAALAPAVKVTSVSLDTVAVKVCPPSVNIFPLSAVAISLSVFPPSTDPRSTVWSPILVPLLVPLFVSAFRIAQDLAMAMEARCYRGGEHRTRMHEMKMKGRDYAAFALQALFLAVIIVEAYFL